MLFLHLDFFPRSPIRMRLVGISICLMICIGLNAQDHSQISPEWDFTPARQFDFWMGGWDVNLRMMQEDLNWEDKIKAKAKIYRILDGKAILELWDSEYIKGYSLRHYDPEKRKWILYLNWPNKNASGTSSLEGSFRHGRGEFFRTSQNQKGKEVISRYTFSDVSDQSLRWDDAFSVDSGKTWTNNWIMEFSRNEDVAPWPAVADTMHTFHMGERCDLYEFRVFEKLVGAWEGTIKLIKKDGTTDTYSAKLKGWKVLDGCAVMNMLEYESNGSVHRTFSMKTYNTYANVFEDTRLDNQPGSVVNLYYGQKDGKKIELVQSAGNNPNVFEKYIWSFMDSNQVSLEVLESSDQKEALRKVKSGQFRLK